MILLFGVLFLFRLGIPEKLFSGPGKTVIPIHTSVPVGETWMNIRQEGRKIGYSQRTYAGIEGGFRFSENLFMKINTMGIVQPLTVHTSANLKPDWTLERFQFDLGSNLFRFKARGEVSGNELVVYIGENREEKKTVISLSEPPYLSGGVLGSMASVKLRMGEVKTFQIFDPASLGQRPVHITVLGEEPLMIMGKDRKSRKLSVEFMGMKQVAWIDQDGLILREEGLLEIVLERVSKEEALRGLEGAFGSDLTEIASIPSSQMIDDAAVLKILKIRLMGLQADPLSKTDKDAAVKKDRRGEEGPFDLDGDRQNYWDDVLTIHRESPSNHSTRRSSYVDNLGTFLKPTPFIQSDHPKIRSKFHEIVLPDDPDRVKAEKLMVWVYKNIEKRPVLSIPNALETLEKRIGDCNEHAVLLAALARAAGIPTEVEAGLVYMRGRFFYHAWNVFYLSDWGGWVTADAVLGQMPADVTHIRFIRGDADRQIDLVGLIGRLKLEVIKMER